MKKFFAISLAIAMAVTMSLSAMAAESTVTSNNGTETIPVKAVYVDGVSTPETVSVNLEWGAMEFTYTTGGTRTWDSATHTYTVSNATNGWAATGNTVKVTNHSDIAVKAAFEYAPVAENTLTGSFTYDNSKVPAEGAISLNAGEVNNPTGADHVTATLTLSGTPATTLTTLTQVGNITVTIKK